MDCLSREKIWIVNPGNYGACMKPCDILREIPEWQAVYIYINNFFPLFYVSSLQLFDE